MFFVVFIVVVIFVVVVVVVVVCVVVVVVVIVVAIIEAAAAAVVFVVVVVVDVCSCSRSQFQNGVKLTCINHPLTIIHISRVDRIHIITCPAKIIIIIVGRSAYRNMTE